MLEATGFDDRCPVVSEPFHEWVLSGAFPAGRPRWQDAGATFTDDVTPYEHRKLWLLNGAHSLLAYAGSIRGHQTVAEAVADETCRSWLEEWWAVASPHLDQPAADVAAYRAALLERFANTRMHDRLDRIAADGSQKLPIRILPVLRAERAAGRVPAGATRVLAAWICHLRGLGAPVSDVRANEVVPLAQGPLGAAVPRVLGRAGPGARRRRRRRGDRRRSEQGVLPDVLVAQDCGGSSGADQLRGVRGQHGHFGAGDHGLLDSTLDEHLGRRPAQCGLRLRAEHRRVEGGVGADDQVADAVVHQAVRYLRPADRGVTPCESAPDRLAGQCPRLLKGGVAQGFVQAFGDRGMVFPDQVRVDGGDDLTGGRFGQLLKERDRSRAARRPAGSGASPGRRPGLRPPGRWRAGSAARHSLTRWSNSATCRPAGERPGYPT